jgi:cell division protein FtsL
MLGRSGMNRIIAVLVMLLMGSSWQIITHQHEIRKLNIALEKEKNRYSDLKLEYHRLELQNSKDTATDHVESIAREKEEAEAAKKAEKSGRPVPTVTENTVIPVDSTKAEIKKEEVKPTNEKIESTKKEVKAEEKSATKSDVKTASKIEQKVESKVDKSKADIKTTSKVDAQKSATKKADPMEDQLGDFIKKHESKSKN